MMLGKILNKNIKAETKNISLIVSFSIILILNIDLIIV